MLALWSRDDEYFLVGIEDERRIGYSKRGEDGKGKKIKDYNLFFLKQHRTHITD